MRQAAIAVLVAIAMGAAAPRARVAGRAHGGVTPAVAFSCANATLGSPVGYMTGVGNWYIVARDLTHDGVPDLAVAPIAGGVIAVMVGTGGGTFGAPRWLAVNGTVTGLSAALVNQDGHPDLVITTLRNVGDLLDGSVEVRLGDGIGNFGPAVDPAALFPGSTVTGVAPADFDDDGDLDVAVADLEQHAVWVVSGDGTGHLEQPSRIDVEGSPLALAAADFNADGHPDLAVTTYDASAAQPDGDVQVLLGDGFGGFTVLPPVAVGLYPADVTAADVNADQVPDVVTSNLGGGDDGGSVSVLLVGDDGRFASNEEIPLYGSVTGVAATDFNGDGRLDLAVRNWHFFAPPRGPVVEILLQDASGDFGPPVPVPVGNGATGMLAAADFDVDGRPDLGVTDQFGPGVSVVPNHCGNAADIGVEITHAPEPPGVGGEVTYSIRVTNHGPDVAGVKVETVVPATATFGSAISSSGHCEPFLSAGGIVRCDVGNLPGAPAGTATIELHLRPTQAGPFDVTATVHTSVVDANDANDTATDATRIPALGGKAFTIATATGGGAMLSWQGGDRQAGYVIGRLVDGVTSLLPSSGVPLPADATAFLDQSPVPGRVNCYAVAPVDAAGNRLGLSNVLCVLPGSASVPIAPRSFSLNLNANDVAVLSWSFDGPPPDSMVWVRRVDTGSTSFIDANGVPLASHATQGRVTCYVAAQVSGATVLQHTEVLCAVPGVENLPP
jgi:hypothetical protein